MLNERNTGKEKFKINGYKLEISKNREVGIINIYDLNIYFKELEDDYIIKMVNTMKGIFIIVSVYALTSEEHKNKLHELNENLKIISKYKNMF